ncbi:MAG: hypothetical protein B7Z67_06520 [Acidiphilium sp. 21-60-14]|nr:MAG: hypothetical protein B7Z67_06520 [Acidiphilium sp. 21-60-14]OYV92393.1 MAG: hypothetical protein B7Z57_01095 [Acidiphilium sp. 37-60-79]OZB40355.1 MAG: hypothetical protein B7X48_05535 [Acidiphilium sp. 34-60-192]
MTVDLRLRLHRQFIMHQLIRILLFIYETWFGPFDQIRFATVFGNIKTIYDALYLTPVVLYYRGLKVTGPTDCAAEAGTSVRRIFLAPRGNHQRQRR